MEICGAQRADPIRLYQALGGGFSTESEVASVAVPSAP
jgi:hypothetical protein